MSDHNNRQESYCSHGTRFINYTFWKNFSGGNTNEETRDQGMHRTIIPVINQAFSSEESEEPRRLENKRGSCDEEERLSNESNGYSTVVLHPKNTSTPFDSDSVNSSPRSSSDSSTQDEIQDIQRIDPLSMVQHPENNSENSSESDISDIYHRVNSPRSTPDGSTQNGSSDSSRYLAIDGPYENDGVSRNEPSRLANPDGSHPDSCWKKRVQKKTVLAVVLILLAVGCGVIIALLQTENRLEFPGKDIQCRSKQAYLGQSVDYVCSLKSDDSIDIVEIEDIPTYLDTGSYPKIHWYPNISIEHTIGEWNFNISQHEDIISIDVQLKNSSCTNRGSIGMKFRDENNTVIQSHSFQNQIQDKTTAVLASATMHLFENGIDVGVRSQCSGKSVCKNPQMELKIETSQLSSEVLGVPCFITNSVSNEYTCPLFWGYVQFFRIMTLTCLPGFIVTDSTPGSITTNNIIIEEPCNKSLTVQHGFPGTIVCRKLMKEGNGSVKLHTTENGILLKGTNGNQRVYLTDHMDDQVSVVKVLFDPFTCIDNGQHQLEFMDGVKVPINIVVTKPSQGLWCTNDTALILESTSFSCSFCVKDEIQAFELSAFFPITQTSKLYTTKPVTTMTMESQTESIEVAMKSPNIVKFKFLRKISICQDNVMFNLILYDHDKSEENRFLRSSVIAADTDYKILFTGDVGKYLENQNSDLTVQVFCGCFPSNIVIMINGEEAQNVTRRRLATTGEIVEQLLLEYKPITMAHNGNRISVDVNFTDDGGKQRSLQSDEIIQVIPERFCDGQKIDCNYPHPREDRFISCGKGNTIHIRDCYDGRKFKKVGCHGHCE